MKNAPAGSGYTRVDGYRQGSVSGDRKYEHIRVAERALGRPLPAGAEVHHVNEDRSDNEPSNLVICPSLKYHALLHMRMKAVAAGYPAHYRWCGLCRSFDDPSTMYVTPSENRAQHHECRRQEQIKRWRTKKWGADSPHLNSPTRKWERRA